MPVLAAPEAAGSERNSPVVPTSASVSPPEQYLASKEWNWAAPAPRPTSAARSAA